MQLAQTFEPNIRFWIYLNRDWVKLTLKPGQHAHWSTGRPTEEGWSSDSEHWTYDAKNAVVIRRWMTDGRDCDGRLAQGGEMECPATKLAAREIDGLAVPKWVKAGTDWQHDEFAIAAGY